jgi:FKBP-type peptidyl-prolyl cis-trans isomerase
MKLQRLHLLMASCMVSIAAIAQNNQPGPPPPPAPPPVSNFTYKTINPQLKYAFIINKTSTPNPQEGDQVSLSMQSFCNNRIVYSTAIAFKGKPGVYGVTKPSFKGDLIEAISLMTPGDSITCVVDAVALFKGSKAKMPDFIKPGDKVQYFIKLVSIKSKEQVQKEQQAAFMKQMQEQQAKQKAAEAKQLAKDDKTLKAYFTKNHLTPTKTASGLYYTITAEGTGEKPMTGDSVSMNYTGTLLDGTKFDSNTDTAFKHTQPYQFPLGRSAVIKGWDEGVALLKTGSKAVFYIPSTMAYGTQARPGSGANPKGIPANSILLFDVELLSSKHPAPPPPKPAPVNDTLKMLKPVEAIKNIELESTNNAIPLPKETSNTKP